MTHLKSLTQKSLQAEMDEWAAHVESATGPASAICAANECARIAAKARRAGFEVVNPHPIKKGG